jgi:hypothetical protein
VDAATLERVVYIEKTRDASTAALEGNLFQGFAETTHRKLMPGN